MKLGYSSVYVADVLATVAFYEKAFGLARRFVHESNLYAEMETGSTHALYFVTISMSA
jgi:lactoylglutathione lyase